VVVLIVLALSIRAVSQYEKRALLRLGRVIAVREPGPRSSSRSTPRLNGLGYTPSGR
jgi:regulator of protease activity HflC (stomatin/prohibitin superfamily)